ncbi:MULTISPECIES: hypothetical protein [Vibrio]|uniref:Stress-associated endoplasmic reticulum protein n=1 Tax=Vibrio cortegadensis TaxID=1328770 RepID=A0ABV4M403_9VIBR|nr:hypothetical protein [Vibrio genomosp. F6]RBW64700.1 hypothetical protein DS893_13530 [Vibrionales bacterium C3R12]TKF21614.1 hypothetical protein FCV43_09800 [Vibrio genomosp. F6]
MAVQAKHNDSGSSYDMSNDFTTDQRQRFAQVANKADKRRYGFEQSSFIEKAKVTAMRPVIKRKPNKPDHIRYVAWLVVIAAFSLWVMYMTR